jgi:hypothetical protein
MTTAVSLSLGWPTRGFVLQAAPGIAQSVQPGADLLEVRAFDV